MNGHLPQRSQRSRGALVGGIPSLSAGLFLLVAYGIWFLYCTISIHSLLPVDSTLSDSQSMASARNLDNKDGVVSLHNSLPEPIVEINKDVNAPVVQRYYEHEKHRKNQTSEGSLEITAFLEEAVEGWDKILKDEEMTSRVNAREEALTKITYGNAESCDDLPGEVFLPEDILFSSMTPLVYSFA